MSCRDMEGLLSEWIDGELPARTAAEVAAHISGCSACRTVHHDLEQLIVACRQLPRLSPPSPEQLWSRIDARLAVMPAMSWSERLWVWLGGHRLHVSSAVAAAALVAVVALHALKTPASTAALEPSDDMLWRAAETEFEAAEEHYLRAIADLRRLTSRERAAWSPKQRIDFDAALAQLDRATAACRQAARAQRRDPEVRSVLYRAYREEISFLEESLLHAAAAPSAMHVAWPAAAEGRP